MAFYPKQSGTTEQTFQIGAGHGKQPFLLDASGFTSPHTWVLPDSDGTGGYTLSTDGAGNLSWSAAGASTPYVPLTINTGDTFTVPTNTQVLFGEPIEVDGNLIVDGDLVDVSQGTLLAAGSNNQIQLNRDGNLFADNNLSFEKYVDQYQNMIPWFKMSPGSQYWLATFGSYDPTPNARQVRSSFFITGNSDGSTTLSTGNTSPNFTNKADLNIRTGNWRGLNGDTGYSTFGGNINLQANSPTEYQQGYAVNGGQVKISGGDSFAPNSGGHGGGIGMYAGNGLGSIAGGTTAGGGFGLTAGSAQNNNGIASAGASTFNGGNALTNIGNANGGAFYLYAGYAQTNSGTANGGNITIAAGSANSEVVGNTLVPGNITLSGGASNDGVTNFPNGNVYVTNCDLVLQNISSGIRVAEGTNAKQGVATMSGGTVTVNTTSVTANSRIFLTIQDPNSGTPGYLWISARTPGTSFTIQSSSIIDTSIVAYEIFEPS